MSEYVGGPADKDALSAPASRTFGLLSDILKLSDHQRDAMHEFVRSVLHEERGHEHAHPPRVRHWAVIKAGNLVVAQGYCWCKSWDGPHRIGVQPS